ncbi:Pyridoxine 4-dehydrogenase [Orbilia brochopaga]|uniref:Pyridoxine 4-dehydrogenase n=1 Tax=Orbilia brochopaga TaxID=3140254 RepID=A0AAV9U5V4_9PEZI
MSSSQTTIAGRKVNSLGFGLMNYTWRPTNTPDEQAFAGISAAIAGGANFLVSGEFYGTQDPQDNLRLLNRYFTAHPEDASKVVLSVKGAVNLQKRLPDGSPAGIRRSIENILEKLDNTVKLDVFTIARVDRSTELEVTWRTVKEEFIDTGRIGGLCLSEVSAATLQRALKITPVACVELEVSLWAMEIYENGIADVCREHGIPIAAYSPLGRGFLTGQLKSPDDIPEGDMRRHFDRFTPENFPKNLELVESVKKIAAKKGVTPSQLALAWVGQYGARRGLTVIPIFGATKEEQVVENLKAADVKLTDEDFAEIDALLKSFKPVGGRYNAMHEATLFA